MHVVVYQVTILQYSGEQQHYFVSDGQGPDISFESATVAAAAAYALGVQKGLRIDADQAEMWLRSGADHYIFRQSKEWTTLEPGILSIAIEGNNSVTRSSMGAEKIYIAVNELGEAILPPLRYAKDLAEAVATRQKQIEANGLTFPLTS